MNVYISTVVLLELVVDLLHQFHWSLSIDTLKLSYETKYSFIFNQSR